MIYRNISTNCFLNTNSFAAPASLPVGSGSDDPYGLAVADLDGDGKLDLVVADRIASQVVVYRNISTAGTISSNSFAPAVRFPVGSDPRNVVVRDLDGDGWQDILTANYTGASVSILRNLGTVGSITTNSFASSFDLPIGSGAQDLTVQDLDGDGKPDLVAVGPGAAYVSVWQTLATPGGLDANSFGPRIDLAGLVGGASVTAADLDGDGKPDLVVGSWNSQTLSVYRNLAKPGSLTDASFASRVDFPVGANVHTVAVGDLDGDGRPDIVLVTELPSRMSVFQNISSPGSFDGRSLGARVDYASGWNASGVAVGDLDGDGIADIVFGNTYDQTVTVYRNVIRAASPPTLAIVRSGSNLALTWSLWACDYVLQSSTGDLSALGTWSDLGAASTVTNFQNRATVRITGPATFYRLRSP